MSNNPDPAKSLGNAPAGTPRPDAVRAEEPDLAREIGLDPAELTPTVRAALSALARENDELRRSLAGARGRLAFFEQLADRDSLVPAYNRRAFMRELRRTISYGARYGTANSVLYFDLNGMKGINDTLGHAAGDAALVQIARQLVANLRDSDSVGRLGGDEFGVILVNADRDTAERKAAALATAVAAEPLRWEGWSIPLETAHGTHTIGDEDTALSALYAADQAMYQQKERLRAAATARRAAAPVGR
jgi:diguanylate cyclase (GGDEF)-like protein